MLWYKHETASQRFRARKTFKTLVRGVPMLILIRDLTLFDADRFATRRAILNVYLLKTFATTIFDDTNIGQQSSERADTQTRCQAAHQRLIAIFKEEHKDISEVTH